MGTSEKDADASSAVRSTTTRGPLSIAIVLAGLPLGYGYMGMEDSNGLQTVVEVVVPGFLLLCVGYVFVEGSEL
jgi:hypothetical protein